MVLKVIAYGENILSVERRKHARRHLEELAARLYWVEGAQKREVDYFPNNVSVDGLSIMLNHILPVEAKMILELDKGDVQLEVKWCKSNPKDPAIFKIGLALQEGTTVNLEELIKQELAD
ncbi:MAG: hypothetical protein OXT67_12080 [Zetaproteobacteria bacterium]|nr:hypothetical protein [Zetaproteobacteria bacterium]